MTGRTRRPALAAPRRRVVAGIPTYYVDGPPPARCALMFRVGRSDETLPTLGITHLIEHLALFGLEGAVHSYNGFVDPNRTVFHASGTEDECLEFLADVTGALMDLPMDRLEQERQVLAAEEEGRGGGMFTSLATVRFGAKGFGLVAYEQFGANTVGPDAIRNWVASRFNAANAVLVLSGVRPDRVDLTLPDGDYWPIPDPDTIEDDLPAWFRTSGMAVGVTMVTRRTPAADAGFRVLQKRLFRRLRTEMAITYDITADVQTVSPDIVHAFVATDPIDGKEDEAQAALDQELAGLAAHGPTWEEMEADRLARERRWEDPESCVAAANTLAFAELLGAPRSTAAKLREAEASVTAQDVAAAMTVARKTALWAIPCVGQAPATMREISMSSPNRLDGRRLSHPHRRGTPPPPKERLVVAGVGIGVEKDDGSHVHVEYERCAGALAWRDGTRVLFGEDGFVLTVRPWEWSEGSTAVAEIDSKLNQGLVVPMGEGAGPPPEPSKPSLGSRWHRRGRSPASLGKRIALVVICLLFLLFGLAMISSGPSVKPADLGLEGQVVVNEYGDLDCGGSSWSIVLHGAKVPPVEGATELLEQRCESAARGMVALSMVPFGISALLAACFVDLCLRRRS